MVEIPEREWETFKRRLIGIKRSKSPRKEQLKWFSDFHSRLTGLGVKEVQVERGAVRVVFHIPNLDQEEINRILGAIADHLDDPRLDDIVRNVEWDENQALTVTLNQKRPEGVHIALVPMLDENTLRLDVATGSKNAKKIMEIIAEYLQNLSEQRP